LLERAEVLGIDGCLRLYKFSLGDRLGMYTGYGWILGYPGCYTESF
jgi:hypothetical protein